ncbi:MAG: N-formylglutamate amidohydrolase [Pseudoxanthomonas suwonensis]|nr:N-formylglutamate amidohydrolase [Pseudoxanthomonas suwonensis]
MATAIHDGHELHPDVATRMALDDAGRLREEDPYTGQAIAGLPIHVIPHRSRFEIDLNRDIDDAVYLSPEQSWGLKVWREPPQGELLDSLRSWHRDFYAMMGTLLDAVARRHPRFVLLDVHSYNHRRDGADAAPTPQDDAPDINIGTFSMPREDWAWLLEPLMEAMAGFDFNGRRLDVRENVAFQGRGEMTRFVHRRHPGTGCAIALEFKKFFMDEWTGQPDADELAAMRGFMRHCADTARTLLERGP